MSLTIAPINLAAVPPLSAAEKIAYKKRIKTLLAEQSAVLIAHYYVDSELQALAEDTQGFIGDSLAMAEFGYQYPATTLVVAGVKFMGETAKILSPHKRVLMPTLEATCSLDLGCPPDQFAAWCDQHPERTVVVYANTSAAVKARADWVVTSSIAIDVIRYLHARGEKILWAPDKYLGDYIAKQTGADMLLWQGSCIVHEEFKTQALIDLKRVHPDAAVLVHPESPAGVIALADKVGSTSQLLKAACELPQQKLIVATDRGILYKMQQQAPHKTFLMAPTAGEGATCRSCAQCPWMAMNGLANLQFTLEQGCNEIYVQPDTITKALIPLQRMLKFRC